ncbi:MAG TPA: CvpA family protein [Burkholderiaceae bacterium]|nr:CvpA family protein [Burkholderiaceae bacterium]
MNEAGTMGWVDGALIAVLAISLAVGVWRGLVFELLSLLGWVAAYVAAQAFAPLVATWLPAGAPGSALNHGAAFAVTFVGALIVWALASRLLRALVHATPLAAIDRLLGAAFGLLRGVVLLLAVTTVVALTPAARSSAWQHSQGAAWLGALLAGLKPVLPAAVARHLPA